MSGAAAVGRRGTGRGRYGGNLGFPCPQPECVEGWGRRVRGGLRRGWLDGRVCAGAVLRVLELFAGIGGAAAAVGGRARVVAAVDVDPWARAVYSAWFPDHPWLARNLAHPRARLPEAELWWLSPPCQPYTVRGERRDADDPRAAPLHALIGRIAAGEGPAALALENVPGFAGSRSHAALVAALEAQGYAHRSFALCATSTGVPMERRRFFLVAARGDGLRPASRPRRQAVALAGLLDGVAAPGTAVDAAVEARFGASFHRVDPADPAAVLACFTSAYGRSPVYAGSYLGAAGGPVRRLSADEGLRVFGFPNGFRFPEGLPPRQPWGLLGNSLAVPTARVVLAAFGPFDDGMDTVRGVDGATLRARPATAGDRRAAMALRDADPQAHGLPADGAAAKAAADGLLGLGGTSPAWLVEDRWGPVGLARAGAALVLHPGAAGAAEAVGAAVAAAGGPA